MKFINLPDELKSCKGCAFFLKSKPKVMRVSGNPSYNKQDFVCVLKNKKPANPDKFCHKFILAVEDIDAEKRLDFSEKKKNKLYTILSITISILAFFISLFALFYNP